MKLYTQEEIKKVFGFVLSDMDLIGYINTMKPIELPSDEEIEKYFSWGYGGDVGSAIYGAKWVIDKIKNQQQ